MKQLMTLALLASVLILASCSSRQELGDVTPTTAEGTASITFDFTLSEPAISVTRAQKTSWYDLKAIHLIDNIRIVFYTEDEGKPSRVAYAFDKEVNNWEGKWTGKDLAKEAEKTASSFSITGVHDIKPDNYIVYFFTTPSDQLKQLTEVGKDFSELKRPISVRLMEQENQGFLAPRYSLSSNIDSPLRLTKEQLTASIGAEALRVGDIPLKALDAIFQCYLALSEERQERAGLWACGFYRLYPDVINKSVILFPEWDKDQANNLTIPRDDNYEGMSEWSAERYNDAFVYNTGVIKQSNYGANFDNRYERALKVSTIVIPENTTSPEELSSRNVTRVIFCVQVIPSELTELPEFASLGHLERTWFSYKGVNYLWSKFQTDYALALTSFSSKEKDLSKVSSSEASILRAGLAINKQVFKQDHAQLGDPLAGTTFTSGLKSQDLCLYKDGFSYYALPIRHYSDDAAKSLDAIGRYAVVRNTRYLVEVKGFNKVGEPTYQDLPSDINFNAAEIKDFTLTFEDKDIISSEVTF